MLYTADDIILIQDCFGCPESYEAHLVNSDDNVGYLRLRNGCFSVRCPDYGGEVIYHSYPKGDGVFDSDERDIYLELAKQSIANWLNKQIDGGFNL